jgi:hypothetical protein
MADKLKILCFKWEYTKGAKLPSLDVIDNYTADHVNRLYNSIERNLTIPHEFICITDNPKGVNCPTFPLWNTYRDLGGCYTRLMLFNPNIKYLFGDRIASIDLDCVVIGSLDNIFGREEDFVINSYIGLINEYSEQWCNGGLILMNTGSRSQVWSSFNPVKSPKIIQKRKKEREIIGTDQAWIAHTLNKSEATFTNEDGVYEYRRFEGKSLPKGAKLVLFAGRADPSILRKKWVIKNWK